MTSVTLSSSNRKFLFPSLLALSLFSLASCAKSEGTPVLPDEVTHEAPANPNLPAAQGVQPGMAEDPDPTTPEAQQILARYDYLDPQQLVPDVLLAKAVLYYDAHLSDIKNKNYLTVVDFSRKSTNARFFIVDMHTGAVSALHVAHGKGSDSNGDGYAESFGNVSGSEKSSLGFYKASETYSGAHGLSMRLDGLSSTNSNVRSRDIVVHGADYVQEASVIQGRSWGCFALAMNIRAAVIQKLTGGSIIYAGLSGLK